MSEPIYLSLHGHFYQPPREDPFTQAIPDEPAAAPYRNFNEKITTECYRPNAQLGNFRAISFDIGPTLASWLVRFAPDILLSAAEANHICCERDGVGNAMAHAYNHTILPLANSRDKRTQIAWGIADFRHRFGREPAGMWLAETAVDHETLAILADNGIRYTILAPWQAAEPIDPTEPYWVSPGNGKRIAVFFYHGAISGAVSFDDRVTDNADAFAAGYLPQFINREKADRGEAQLLLVATDGELYGHHKPFRDRFLERLCAHSAPAFGLTMTTPGLYLRDHPPTREMAIVERSAWSCAHGVARWSTGCACTQGDASWKPALRAAMDHLAERVDLLFEHYAGLTLADPWAARDGFLEWRQHWLSPAEFWERFGTGGQQPGSALQAVRTWHLLEAEFRMQAAYTSCGWFFEDLDRIEPRIVVNAARCAISHLWQALHADLQTDFMKDLAQVHSWRNNLTGDVLYRALPLPPGGDLLPPLAALQSGDSAA
jgi:hypothetical protein